MNQRTKWRDLVTGYDPANIPGVPAETIRRMEMEEDENEGEKADDATTARNMTTKGLLKIVRTGLAKNECYLDLIGQVGSTPHEFFEDMVRTEKDLLKL